MAGTGARPRGLTGVTPFVTLVLALALPVAAQTPAIWTVEATLRYRGVGPAVVSPDGSRAAVVVSQPIMRGDTSEWRSVLHVLGVGPPADTTPLWSEADASSPAWSPDGRWLAFASSRSGTRSIWRVPASGGSPEQITALKQNIGQFQWSPDGRWIAFVAVDAPSEEEERAAREGRDVQVVGESHRFARLYVTAAEPAGGGQEARLLTPQDVQVGGHVGAGLDGPAFTWAPDGSQIAFTHSPSPLGDDWTRADVSVVDLDGGSVRPLIATPGAEGGVSWSPDGRWIAVPVSDVPATYALTTRIHLISPATGEVRPLAESFDRRPSLVGWSPDARRVIISEVRGVRARLSALPVNGDASVDLSPDTLHVASATLTGDGSLVGFMSESADHPPEAYVASLDGFAARRITAFQPEVVPRAPRTEVVQWRSFDGTPVEGLLTYPVGPVSGERPPLLVILHGGPPSAFTNTFVGRFATYPIGVFAQQGFAVLRPNVRGSSGYGRDFRYANAGDWGGGDFRDVMAGIDTLAARGMIDITRLGVMGWSYGGYLTATTIARTTRFRAASVGAGITDLISYSGTADIPSFVPSYYGGDYWAGDDVWRRDSAIHNVARITTPTLIQHGERDERVPIGQGYQLYHALHRQGVPVRMLVFPRQGHSLTEPRFQLEAARENVEWFERWLK